MARSSWRKASTSRRVPCSEALIAREPDNEYAYFFPRRGPAQTPAGRRALAAYVKAISLAPGYAGAMVNAADPAPCSAATTRRSAWRKKCSRADKNDIDALFADNGAVALPRWATPLPTLPDAAAGAAARSGTRDRHAGARDDGPRRARPGDPD